MIIINNIFIDNWKCLCNYIWYKLLYFYIIFFSLFFRFNQNLFCFMLSCTCIHIHIQTYTHTRTREMHLINFSCSNCFLMTSYTFIPSSNYQNELYLMSGIIFEKTLAFHLRHNWALANVSRRWGKRNWMNVSKKKKYRWIKERGVIDEKDDIWKRRWRRKKK